MEKKAYPIGGPPEGLSHHLHPTPPGHVLLLLPEITTAADVALVLIARESDTPKETRRTGSQQSGKEHPDIFDGRSQRQNLKKQMCERLSKEVGRGTPVRRRRVEGGKKG